MALLASTNLAKVSEERGLVFGWAIVCKKDGEDYYDLNVDQDGERVPEHITEDAMFKAAADAAQAGVQMAGNDMHEGPDSGSFWFMLPLTTEMAKALEIETKRTGLIVGYKPEPDVLEKFKDGSYTGFSIEGARVSFEEQEAE